MYQKILKKVGIALIITGIIDIIIMVWVVSNSGSYSSSFNIFAIIAGVFLLKNNLKAARIITLFSSFYLIFFIGSSILSLFLFPISYWLAFIKLSPIWTTLSDVGIFLIIISLLLWIYLNLTSKAIIDAMAQSGLKVDKAWKNPKAGFVIGFVLSIIMGVFMFTMFNTSDSKVAIAKAKNQNGENYNYVVSSINISSYNGKKSVNSIVTAYNNKEIKNLQINWEE